MRVSLTQVLATVFDTISLRRNIRSDRIQRAPIDNTKSGVTCFGSKTAGASTGATGNYATIGGGDQNTASGTGSTVAGGVSNTASGDYSGVLSGISCTASGYGAQASGSSTVASGFFAVAFGQSTLASGNWARADGSQTTASADYASASGDRCQATGQSSDARGQQSVASGVASMAAGFICVASGAFGSHAEGYINTATEIGAHAEGFGPCYAYNRGAHAEGYQTVAGVNAAADPIGRSAHAEGGFTSALSAYSHAAGFRSSATRIGQYAHSSANVSQSQYSRMTYTALSTNGAAAIARDGSANEFLLAEGRAYHVRVTIVATRTDVPSTPNSWVFETLVHRAVAGAAVIDASLPAVANLLNAWTAVLSASGNNLRATCTGAVGQTVRFTVTYQWSEVGV